MSSRNEGVTLVGGVSIGIGGMVGGGIFAVLGVAAEQAGGATPVAFMVAGLVAALTAYSYAKLSVRYPSGGGTVTFVDRVFGVDTVSGSVNVLLWAGYMATIGLYAAAFGHYGAALLPGDLADSAVVFKSLAVVGILVPWLINLANAGIIARTESFVVAIKLVILMIVVAVGMPSADPEQLRPDTWSSPFAIVAAGMVVFVAYEGFELIANSAEEIARPRRNLPLAFGLSVGIVIVLYVAISAVVVGSLSPEEILASSDFALAEAASGTLGQAGFVMVGVSALLATFSAINATLYGSARLGFTIATEGELPDAFRRRQWNQPIGLHITAVVGAAIAVGLPLASISGLASLIFLLVFSVVNVAAVRADDSAGVNRLVSGVGALLSGAAFVVLTVESLRNDATSLIVFVVLVGVTLIAEHAVLRHRRPPLRLDTRR